MREQDAIKAILDAENVRRPELGQRMGLSADAVWQRLHNQKGLSVSVLVEMASALGYKLVLEPVVKTVTDADGNVVRRREKIEVTA